MWARSVHHDLELSTVTWSAHCDLRISTMIRKCPLWHGSIHQDTLWSRSVHCDLIVFFVPWDLHSDPDGAQCDLGVLTVTWKCSLLPKSFLCNLGVFIMTWECSQCHSTLWPGNVLCGLIMLPVTPEIWDGHSSGQKCSDNAAENSVIQCLPEHPIIIKILHITLLSLVFQIWMENNPQGA